VRAGRVDIRSSLASDSGLLATFKKGETISSIGHSILTLTLNKDSGMLILSDIQRLLTVSILEEIEELFIVDLQEGAVNSVIIWSCILVAIFNLSIVFLLNFMENLLNCPGYDSKLGLILKETVDVSVETQTTERVLSSVLIVIPVLSEHGVCFSRASLTISENCCVEALDYVSNTVCEKRGIVRLLVKIKVKRQLVLRIA
jgi:hypothetical protein